MFKFYFLIITINNFLIFLNADNYPQTKIEEGYLQGKYMKSKDGRIFSAFLGIPYAKPPIDHLRFKPPVPVAPWSGILKTTKVHNVCPQRDIYRRTTLIEGDEDCLYLNVYTPEIKPSTSYPVMFFIHGGGWLCGGGNSLWYGPEILLDKDIVLVVTNYRIGALGFLSTGDEICPGNNGLKDQNLALKWVKKNIKYFGGDENKITLFGESAGGASVQFHMVSPMSQGLFHGAISQSGTAHCKWALHSKNQGVRNSKKLANLLNCPTSPSEIMIDCLRKIDSQRIIEQDRAFMIWDTDPMIPFKPTIEPNIKGAFLIQHPLDSIKSGNMTKVPWIVGLNSEDGALRSPGIYANNYLLQEFNENFNEIIPMSLEYDAHTNNIDFITKKLRHFYFNDEKIDKKKIQQLTNLYTDGWFLHGTDEAVRVYLKYVKQPVYYYLFAHRGAASFTEIFGDPENDYGVCHADELQYLFPVGDILFPKAKHTEKDKKVEEILTTLWTNFAKTGNPTPDDDSSAFKNKWSPVKSKKMEYYYINADEPEMKEGLLLDRAEFWLSLPIKKGINEIYKDEL